MKKYYTIVGIASLILIAVLLLTCPKEADFRLYIQDKYGLNCHQDDFTCIQKVGKQEEKMQFVSTDARNGVFFLTIKQKFETEAGKKKEYSGFGIFGTFLFVSEKTFS
ncbi:hypothetical protein ACRS6Y_16410 [Bacillus cytotoxicus]|uniref:Lipoprotein n=1 Tax=Bacillus cytotoxicus (strain DSM 22905 / CIP 110041 / 391-98 / NVH 391-98) TaxID=315749 RepID=A7GP41_BACCN|nr:MULTISPECIES: hypothetical protein [Bacillus cereus group]ABS21899.1 conserved hypothetical protein [Bacillus cytotoxicus NVH 391-98]AWC44589.1 hypothetical protein CG479_008650 [Bacillus cytotoxicus]MDH2863261.1 hypothetical protein [Bacillus cytotoxicus]MDH2880229.1 hypothetical protein [Bacillus cytotoxicus]MDH2882810.1 hypothetical protein [Bacillus cytotoxicus]